ncbi:hypothetical protein A3B45_01970 [Candidatus Daviesbacteria bacterium RIFCSPLOWO2_01_FULL_39_12]|uniref:Uncharacterized protein n=1 Tax=Candidatus Daviesbacteria bacterium RIFCSPLOWO2_01_FULL_39_12 TaxID=1797785 RepID=A0A1F5KM08_9BACT|nr:MAG: hypothetical protein A3B45_01970 [Candidatus Daviesbacteria bacterium RIFCSPLOWO2_01_FULL_39_12]
MEREVQPLKFSNKQTLGGLKARASALDKATERLQIVQRELGDRDTPSYIKPGSRYRDPIKDSIFIRLNRSNLARLSRQDRDAGIVEMVEAKERIGEVIIPALDTQKSQVAQKIAEAEAIVSDLEEVKQLKSVLARMEAGRSKGYATGKDILIIRQDLQEAEEQTVIYFNQPQPSISPLETPPAEPTDEIPEEENIRRKALLDVINSAALYEKERKVFKAGVVYSNRNLGSFGRNAEWAKSVYPNLPVGRAIANLETRRRSGLKKLLGKIELVSIYFPAEKRKGYYLKLVEQKPASKPEFGAEPGPAEVDRGIKDYSGRSAKFKKQLPDGQEIEIRGKQTANTFDLIINSTKENPIPSEKVSAQAVPHLRRILEPRGYKIIQTLGHGERNKGQKGTYYLEKVQTQISPEQQEEIIQLEQSLAILLASRPAIAEGVSFDLPRNSAVLQELDTLVTQKQARLKELGQG